MQVTDLHHSQNSLDWQGAYSGILPCDDCEGIKTTLILQDSTYILRTSYLGSPSLNKQQEGLFKWSEDGSTVSLSEVEGIPSRYKVGEGNLIQLDADGNERTSDLRDHDMLRKLESPILDVPWKLTELNGIGIDHRGGRPITLTLSTAKGNASGFAGCNGYGSEFDLNQEKIQFLSIFSTEMACPELDIEELYLKALQKTDNYTFSNDTLMLKNKDTALAMFIKDEPN